ncbi:MAG: hypothetical protein VX835_03635 [Pseudomonadota bacterium]|nr:hypothetical protein [Pseudomonadota bacterium]
MNIFSKLLGLYILALISGLAVTITVDPNIGSNIIILSTVIYFSIGGGLAARHLLSQQNSISDINIKPNAINKRLQFKDQKKSLDIESGQQNTDESIQKPEILEQQERHIRD